LVLMGTNVRRSKPRDGRPPNLQRVITCAIPFERACSCRYQREALKARGRQAPKPAAEMRHVIIHVWTF